MVGTVLENVENVHEPILKEALASFPYSTREDGSCEMLINNHCFVYEDRPMVCNVERMQQAYEEAYGTSKEEYYNLSISVCNGLIKEKGLPEKYLIPHLGPQ